MVVLLDKLSITTVVFFRSEGKLKSKCLYGISHISICFSDLKKTTVVVESLSNNTTSVLFQGIPAYFKTIQDIMWSLDFLPYESDVLYYFQARICSVHSSLYALREDVNSLYEYMRALASQELNPMIIPPDILKKILHKVIEDIKSNARLKLCEDPETNIWSYYGTVKLTPVVLQDYLMLILTVPLVDHSLQMNLYKVHSFPMLHPTLNVHSQYELGGTYLTTLMDGMFILLPTALDVELCLVTNRHLCMFDQALYPVECINWCIYALIINDQNQIRKDCLLKTLN